MESLIGAHITLRLGRNPSFLIQRFILTLFSNVESPSHSADLVCHREEERGSGQLEGSGWGLRNTASRFDSIIVIHIVKTYHPKLIIAAQREGGFIYFASF